MNFIIERQEHTAAQQAANAEQLARNAEQLALSEALINALAGRQLETSEQLDDHEERIARFERSYTAISALLQRHDTQLVTLTDNLNNLITTVNHYITTRGRGEG
jgi:chromosome segregation ATPase